MECVLVRCNSVLHAKAQFQYRVDPVQALKAYDELEV